MTSELPLVSVGIPTYNRPEGLQKTLERITGQTYKNLEIIVSDNCSPNPETERVVKNFQKNDSRIHYYRQGENKGPLHNFNFVLEHATGEFFMEAADDDFFELFYIEECLDIMKKRADVVGVTMEVQYFFGTHFFEFFHESFSYYNMDIQNAEQRVICLLKHSTGGGNILYSLFRRNVLFRWNETIISVLTTRSLNEIPFLMLVIEQGNLIVLPKIGLYKQTRNSTYLQAKWEVCGGFLSSISISEYLHQVYANLIYHVDAYRGIIEAITLLQKKNLIKIFFVATWETWKHFVFLTVRYKPKKYSEDCKSLPYNE